MAGHGSGGFDGEQGGLYPSHNTGYAAGGVTRDFWGSSDRSPFIFGVGSNFYPNSQLGFDGHDINGGDQWVGDDVEQYADHLRGSRDLMQPPVRVLTAGSPRRPLFRPPRHAGQPVGLGDEGFGDQLTSAGGSNPCTARTTSRTRGRGHRNNSHP